eukprot:scaffold170261_cov51-Prasinocladus_malaysianus.AAC.1
MSFNRWPNMATSRQRLSVRSKCSWKDMRAMVILILLVVVEPSETFGHISVLTFPPEPSSQGQGLVEQRKISSVMPQTTKCSD